MPLIFVHLSDIHFGQEKGGDLYVHDDVKEQLLTDVFEYVSTLSNKKADGIIISGDIAFSGKKKEYDLAGQWLDRLTAAVGCEITDVQVVPGNHDVDLEKITPICQIIVDNIIANGDDALDKFLNEVEDREFFYGRFHAYRTFAEGYDSPLDADGYVARQRTFEIAPNRRIIIHGVNTALICSKSKKEEGGLLLGKRQRILIPNKPGLELIVIAHHPLRWLQDSGDAAKYLKNRARVLISGHEHNPSHKIEAVENGGDLLMIASGAVVPPQPNDKYTYCYNVLEFDWDEINDQLKLTIHGRIWDDDRKSFVPDAIHFNQGKVNYTLRCPNFKKLTLTDANFEVPKGEIQQTPNLEADGLKQSEQQAAMVSDKEYQLVLLKFFRELSSAQRLSILIQFGAIPDNWSDQLTHSLERRALDKLIQAGLLSKIHDAINTILYSN